MLSEVPLLVPYCFIRALVVTRLAHPPATGERGQATAEYALVLLGVAAIAVALASWAIKSGRISDLFDKVLDTLLSRAG